MAYNFPSVKSLGNLPTIEIECDHAIFYQNWFNAHKEIPRAVPPIYQDFVIRFSLSFSGTIHNYIEIVHYTDDLCSFECCHIIDGKKTFTATVDYARIIGDEIAVNGSYPATTRYDSIWLKNETIATALNVLAIQAYIIYHKPEIVPVYIDSPAPARRKSDKTAPAARIIKPTKIKYIRLTASDIPPKQINYRAIQWTVRGFYRRYHYKDGTTKLKYIAPHQARRGKKKIKASKIIMK